MLLQRLAIGATGVKEARYRQGPTRGGTRTRMRSIHCVSSVQCETMHGVTPASSGCIRIPPRVLHFSAIHTLCTNTKRPLTNKAHL